MIWSPTWMLKHDHSVYPSTFNAYIYRPSFAMIPWGLNDLTKIPSFSKPLSAPTPMPNTLKIKALHAEHHLNHRRCSPYSESIRSFFDFDWENIHLFDSLFQLILGCGCKRIDILVPSVIFTWGICWIDLDGKPKFWHTYLYWIFSSYPNWCMTELHSSGFVRCNLIRKLWYAWFLIEDWRWRSVIYLRIIGF